MQEEPIPSISHYDLCLKTAEWSVKKSKITVYDYKSYATGEFPDCLSFNGSQSTLYEIKVGRGDFLSDRKKECRKEHKVKVRRGYYWESDYRISPPELNAKREEHYSSKTITKSYTEYPHMGIRRYYVCPEGLIMPEEVGNWGLIWFNGKFSIKKKSEKFRRNLYEENALLVHALRKKLNGESVNVIAKGW